VGGLRDLDQPRQRGPHGDRGTAFDSGLIEEGESYSLTFVRAGTYRYCCTPHPYMTATVMVRPASGGPQPPTTDTVAVAESGIDAPTTPGLWR